MAEGMIAQGSDRVKRLLVVVDGEAAHLHFASMLLQRLEYKIHAAKTAEEALEMVGVEKPALVLTEMMLPGMSGLELLQKIKRNPKTFSLPVIILTKAKDAAVKESCLKENCNAFLQKPVDPDVLYAAIQRATETAPRQYIRLNTRLNVIVGDDRLADTFSSGDSVTALSENGMFISTAKPKPVGQEMPITIFLEGSKIKVRGMVLYSFRHEEGPLKTPGMGLRFVRIEQRDQDVIRLFITRAITSGLTKA